MSGAPMADTSSGVHLTAEKIEIARSAGYQVEGMLKALHGAALNEDGRETLPYLVQSMAVRLSELNNLVLFALDPETEVGDLKTMLMGQYAHG